MKNKYLILILSFIISLGLLYFVLKMGNKNIADKTNPPTALDSTLFTSAPVLTATEALSTFKLAEGFRIELVASEPLIINPVAMAFDGDGRIWVVEMQGFMPDMEGQGEDQKTGRIVILEDGDNDGVMDHSKIFLDSLVLPRAIAIVADGILYAEPPNLWFVQNRNDQPGIKLLVDSIYAVDGNPEHQPNGLLRGIDNWYYNAKSRYRYKLRGSEWIKEETEFRGQWGITKDDYGRLFYNTNSNQFRGDLVPPNMLSRKKNFDHSGAINVQIVHDQKVYPVRPTTGVNRGYKDEMLDEDGKLVEFTAACGPLIYNGNTYPKEFYGNSFVCEPAANLIKRNILIEKGLSVEGRQAYENNEFLASTDERFRPVNLYNSPDGNMYILDMYKGIIQHSFFLTDYLRNEIRSRDLEKKTNCGRIYRIRYDKASILNKLKNMKAVSLNKASDEKLVSWLSHPNGWWRDNAQRILVERNNHDIIPEIIAKLKQKDPLGQIHALWTLEGMGIHGPEIVKLGIQAKDPKVVATALRIGERNKGSSEAGEILELYEGILKNDDGFVQLQLALSAGEFIEDDPVRVMDILKAVSTNKGDNELMAQAIVSSIGNNEKEFLQLLKEKPAGSKVTINVLENFNRETLLKDELRKKELTKTEEQQYITGAPLYTSHCAPCHHENGQGLVPIAPPLAGSEWVTGSKERLIQVVLHGLQGPVTVSGKEYKQPEVQPFMPGFKDHPELTDQRLAALLTYIRNAWNNEATAIEALEVTNIRKNNIDREEPYTEQDFRN